MTAWTKKPTCSTCPSAKSVRCTQLSGEKRQEVLTPRQNESILLVLPLKALVVLKSPEANGNDELQPLQLLQYFPHGRSWPLVQPELNFPGPDDVALAIPSHVSRRSKIDESAYPPPIQTRLSRISRLPATCGPKPPTTSARTARTPHRRPPSFGNNPGGTPNRTRSARISQAWAPEPRF